MAMVAGAIAKMGVNRGNIFLSFKPFSHRLCLSHILAKLREDWRYPWLVRYFTYLGHA